MRWLFTPDSLNIFTDETGRCGNYETCSCYCPPMFVKLEIAPPPIE